MQYFVTGATGFIGNRLVKKLRRRGVADLAAGNAFLETDYWAEHNQRFARPSASSDDFHVALPRGVRLDAVFRLEGEDDLRPAGEVHHRDLHRAQRHRRRRTDEPTDPREHDRIDQEREQDRDA